jgi:hypothetical protein
MPALENHSGLNAQTIPFFNKRNFVNISNTNPFYSIFPALQRNAKKAIDSQWTKFQFGLPTETFSGGGNKFKFNLQVTSDNRWTPVSEDDPVSITKKDFQVQAEYPWRLVRTGDWSYGEWELSACKGPEEIVSLITSRQLGSDQGAADGFENWGWGVPPPSTDDKTPFPIRYSLFTEPESTVGSYSGFTGINAGPNGNLLNVNHNSYTAGPGGISRASYRTAGNWNCQYTTFSDTDFVEKLQHAVMDTEFHSPVEFPNMVKGPPERAMYTTKANMIIRGRLARQQNDANTSDLAARVMDTDIWRIPMFRVPQFDNGTFALYGGTNKDVVYGIDWSTWYWASRTGFHMEDKLFAPSREAPFTTTHARFLGGQLCCLEPRRNFVLSK